MRLCGSESRAAGVTVLRVHVLAFRMLLRDAADRGYLSQAMLMLAVFATTQQIPACLKISVWVYVRSCSRLCDCGLNSVCTRVTDG
jgi:hypothetical protein